MKRIINIGRNVEVIMLVATGFGHLAAVQANPMIVQITESVLFIPRASRSFGRS